ncbi:RICIN domain-containing protein [Spongiimicrobium salis]|uniref:RICIN domain-containing protein n=1 Tax=Spongiimicrobium salis TaxID=1667022 RepID=UPI00374DD2D2
MKKFSTYLILLLFFLLGSTDLLGQKAGKSYYLKSALEAKCLDVQWGKTANGTPLHLWPSNKGKAQQFSLEDAGNGYFYLKSALGKYIHVQNRSSATKALALLWEGKGNDNTKWKFIPAPNGYFYIKSKKGTYLDVKWGKSDNGTPIWMWSFNGGDAQKWKLEEIPQLIPYYQLSNVVLTSYLGRVAEAQKGNKANIRPGGPNFDEENFPIFSNLNGELTERFDHNESIKFSRLNANLIRDKVPGSGVFYYVPNAYYLHWDKDVKEHQLTINYSRNNGDRANKSARVSATLSSGITSKEINFMEDMIREMLRSEQGIPNPKVELKALPVTSPRIEFTGGGFDINEDQITIVPSSNFTRDIEISFTTSDDNIDALKNGELQNKMSFLLHFQSDNDTEQSYDIPASISIMDEPSYGIFEVDIKRLQTIDNPTPYPIMLQYVHVLTTKNSAEGVIPYIYSFSLEDKIAQPNDKLAFHKPSGFMIPRQLRASGKPLRAFVEYKLRDCDACTQKIINDLTGGLTAATKQEVKFRTVNLLKSTGAQFIMVRLKSTQLDPGKQREIETYDPLEINQDNEEQKSPTLYLMNGEQPNFEYKVTLVMPNGEMHESTQWIAGNTLKIFLSTSSLQPYFNRLPQVTSQDSESENEGGE